MFVLATSVFLLNACEKEYSYEGGGFVNSETAVYNITDSSGNCSMQVSGAYYTGTALTAGNVVTIEVYVTDTGTYNINTAIINGIQFSASGTFITTGTQTIALTGSGSPGSAGDFNYSIKGSCSFAIHVTQAPVVNGVFTLVGAPDQCTDALVSGTYISGRAVTSANTIVIKADVSSPGPYSIQTDTLDNISFSASGTFTNAGIQTITLTATGTPQHPSNLSFNIDGGASLCDVDVTVRNPEPLASYVLESGFGNTIALCTGYTLSGDYIQGTPLTNSNYIALQVYVAETGNFTIATNVVNGVQFSYTGTFTATGTQHVNLYGSGTPAASGIFQFIPEIVGPHPIGGERCGLGVTFQ